MDIKRFNIRVYGLLINQGEVLVTDEHRGIQMTKFPGGGLEKGEGLEKCLIREFDEELGINVEVGDFYYVNPFFQQSRFNVEEQLLSMYYFVNTKEIDKIPLVNRKKELQPGEQVFRWVTCSDLEPDMFTFPIDKIVASLLR